MNINDLVPDARNANKGTVRGRGMVEASLREVGAGRSIVVDREGRVIAGNKTLESAVDIGLEIQVVHTTGDRLVVVQRDDLDLSDDTGPARKLAYLDNQASSVGLSWDAEQLLADMTAGVDLSNIFNQDELDDLLAGLVAPEPVEDTPPDVSKADELQKKWNTSLGQLWSLGVHRLICGDCTDKATVERLMQGEKAQLIVTDPPYGVDYEGGTTKREKLSGDATPDLYAPVMKMAYEFSDDSAAVYLWHSDSKSAAVSAAVSAAKYERRCTIIWNKNQAQFGALGAQYKTKHEPCYYLYKKGCSPKWYGPTNEVTVWDIDRNRVNEYHPTEKPVEVMSRPILNSSATGDIVIDFFLGSGSTLMACEILSRRCFASELSPAYVAVALQRFQDATGQTPVLIS